MKTYLFFATLFISMIGLACQSCTTAAEGSEPRNIEGHVLMSRSNAQAQLDDLLDNNAYLDLDLSHHIVNTTREFTDYDILQHAVFYRFYQLTGIENNRIVVKGTAADINMSERTFNQCVRNVVDRGNEMIVFYMSMGYTPAEAVKKTYHVTPESIAYIRVLR